MALTVPYKHTHDMMPENWNSAVREVPRREPLLGSGLVIGFSNSRACPLYITLDQTADKTLSSSSTVVSLWLGC